MCTLLREPDASVPPAPRAEPLRGPLRPRWVAGAGLAFAAVVAVGAMVAAPPAQAPERVHQATGLVPVAARATTATPNAAGGVERTALPADDDVPTSSGPTKTAYGHCHEGL